MYDALIIGGGPSGATIGYLLAKAGWSVAIVEKKKFPRRKVCGEYISATTLSLLPQLSIYEEFCSLAGPDIKNIELYADREIIGSIMPTNKESCHQWGRALGRESLDNMLLLAAKREGAIIWQSWNANNLLRNGNHFICNIKAKNQNNELAAGIIIMAHGSWEKQGWENRDNLHNSADLLAFKAHFTDSNLRPGTMPLLAFPGGYGGMVHSDNGRTSLSCCIHKDQLKNIRKEYSGMHAGDALFQHLIKINRGVLQCLSSAKREGAWLSAGPIRPGIRTPYADNIFYVGNVAGEAHPIVAEGISMAIQSAWMLATILITFRNRQTNNWILEAGIEYQKKWRKKFVPRIYAAALFATLASNKNTINCLIPFIRAFPNILSCGARLSGKIIMP